ncbi:hypothetical protein [Amycolatopsis anabasis]|uniref:hypothetical protein n=1 Tax=Amycolatopsis anabasis TaxID=1840409 RepID=UPI00131D83DD|nr:hypothetical protein [Amycolatopsis anabasis]
MSENDGEPPAVVPSGQTAYQWTIAAQGFISLFQRLAANRERKGRMAYDDAEQAALAHLQRQVPPMRLMSTEEQEAWQRRVPADLATQTDGEPFAVWWAKMDDEGSGWGVEAHTYTPSGAPSSSLFVVCRDHEDAIELSRWLRDHPTPRDLARIHEVAGHSPGEYEFTADADGAEQNTGPRRGGDRAARPLVLGEDAWAAALGRNVPEPLATRLLAESDLNHPDFPAWQELHRLANEEVGRVGADPDKLAGVIGRMLSGWREVKWPSRAAHSVLNQARELPRYEDMVRSTFPGQQAGPAPGTGARDERGRGPGGGNGMVVDSEVVDTTPPRPRAGSSPAEALKWAQSLDPRNLEHRVMAKAEYTRWGSAVDEVLQEKFPSVVPKAKDTARKEARRRGEAPVAAATTGTSAAETPAAREIDAETLAAHAKDVERLDPAKSIDRRAALTMLGHVPPEIDRMIADKFADDERITERVTELYPDGLPEAASWRNRADADDAHAAANMSTPDSPQTPAVDEQAQGQAAATGEQHAANAEKAAAGAASARTATVRHPGATPPARPRTRR